jgi:hypothetical protein
MYFELDKYLYGLQDAPHAFNQFLDEKLRGNGFKPTLADKCMYIKHDVDGLLILSIHVDDLLLTSPSARARREFEDWLSKQFQINIQRDNVSYLGMSITRTQSGAISVRQPGYIQSLLERCNCLHVAKPPPTPTAPDFMEIDPDSPPCDKTEFLSLVMALMFLARLTRPDILMPVSYLATRTSVATEQDYRKLLRIARYLSGTPNVGLLFKDSDLIARLFADASHGIYPDGHGQAGIVITLGSAPIFCRSTKIKSITRSSSESELVALEDAATYVVWLRALLHELLGPESVSSPTAVFQDNKSTIIMAVQGGNFKRTKHLICKEGFVRERILHGDMKLIYLPSGAMLADMLTKPLERIPMERFMRTLRIN